jgi:hypothetical protein
MSFSSWLLQVDPGIPHLEHCGAACGRPFSQDRMDLFLPHYARFALDYAPGQARAATLAREGARWSGPRDYVEKEVTACLIASLHNNSMAVLFLLIMNRIMSL